MVHIFAFERLDVWQKARSFVREIYNITTNFFPQQERYALAQQLQRAAISIVSNIAEGTSRSSLKEQCRFTEVAYGSLMEVYCQLIIAKDLNYINEEQLETVKQYISLISNQLNALRNSQLKRLQQLNN
ncbi:MAG: four helix bundle protein [Bacteroidales bacterium]|nr:four helix bundle protein [Bacteroidales bacterium]